MFPNETRFLVADDMVGMRKLVKQNLQQLGYRNIVDVEDGEAAYRAMIDALLEKRPFDVVLSDWKMPKMNGLEFLKAVRDHPELSATVFLLVTAENEFEQVKAAIALGVHDYVVKPFTPQSLKSKLLNAWKKTQSGADHGKSAK
jgi:two-component system chemotaxis response regulator CheY